jgi:hypothetical protein
MLKSVFVALLLASLLTRSGASTSTTSPPTTVATPSSIVSVSNGTCPSRTVNYITHGLPQQCLTSSWRGSPTPVGNVSNATDAVLAETREDAPASTASQTTIVNSTSFKLPENEAAQGNATDAPESESRSGTPASASPLVAVQNTDDPSPLEDDKFMSFEEWKQQNLKRAGQSEHIGRDAKLDAPVPRRRPTNIHTALDSLGDDAEIDLDFSGLMPAGPDLHNEEAQYAVHGQESATEPQSAMPPTSGSRSKDAGTTSKERYNYASFDCAASVRKANPEAMSMTAVLGENKDSYMLNVCSAQNKFLILELCNDISIDTIVLANFEFFSSIFRTFRVSVSDKYPVKMDKWKTLGTFEARNTRGIQAFLIENPAIWARYLRIEFLTHYGSEYYCPVSLVRVHGTTMMEDYKRDLESSHAGDDSSDEVDEVVAEVDGVLVPQAIGGIIHDETDAAGQSTSTTTTTEAVESFFEQDKISQHSTSSDTTAPMTTPSSLAQQDGTRERSLNVASSLADDTGRTSDATDSNKPVSPSSQGLSQSALTQSSEASIASTSTETGSTPKPSTTGTNQTYGLPTNVSTIPTSSGTMSNSTANSIHVHTTANLNQTLSNTTTLEKPKGSATGSASAAAPTMQDSFFRSVQKRLQMLESNSSLSLQYIEDQSRALRDAFNKVEQRQLAKTTTFLDYLNTTVLSELRDFRQQYDQLWQSTVIELETQRERYQQETAAMNARIGILADELIFQKRVSILQMTLILICLGLILFTRGHLNQYLELPVVQRVLSRSPSSRWLNLSGIDTPTQSPPPTRDGSLRKRHGILKGHRRMQSEDSVEGSLSPQEPIYSPPTPTSIGDASDGEPMRANRGLDDPEFDPSAIERPSTSPPVLPSTDPSTPELNSDVGNGIDSIEARLLDSPPVDSGVPKVVVEEATPPIKQLSWSLPDS